MKVVVATEYDLKQVINESTYLLENSSSCIDLIFTSQPNLVMNAGVYPSLHTNCHHQIVYAMFNLKIYHSPPYKREACHFQKVDINLFRKTRWTNLIGKRPSSILISMRWYLFVIQL